jgi:hypothetical protein
MYCLVKRQEENIRKITDENLKSDYMREVLRIIADSPEEVTAPVVIADINCLHQRFFGASYSFDSLKKEYNQYMLGEEPKIYQEIISSPDPLLTALKLARTGNYIDFGAMGSIDNAKLRTLLSNAKDEFIDPSEYVSLKEELKNSSSLVYLTDNCGEIVLDKLLIQVIKEQFPNLIVTVIVRGLPVLNDATLEDAEMTGLTAITKVIGNGTQIAGTQPDLISSEARELLENADVIISKGQGNFETLHGWGFNAYYMFLCKCDWFVNRFGLERYKGVLLNEKHVAERLG